MEASDVTSRSRSLLRFGPTDPQRRIFCLPFAGGGPATYRQWPKDLPAGVEVVAVQLPGRAPSSRDPLLDSVDDLVEFLLPAVEAATDLPYGLFGHSMGALVAFELTLALERGGAPAPSHLFVSGRRSPNEPHTAPPIHALPDDAFLDALDRSFGGVPAVIRNEPELLALLLPALRADVRAYETYTARPDRRVRCPLVVYGGADDTHPRPDQLAAWQCVAEREISVRVFPGDHFYLATARAALTADITARWSHASTPVGP